MAVTPTADFKRQYFVADGSDVNYPQGTVVVDYVIGPDGNLMTVDDEDRLAQDFIDFLYRRLGDNPLDPTDGNAEWDEVGRPGGDLGAIRAMIEYSEAVFTRQRAIAAAQGYVSLAGQIDSIQVDDPMQIAPGVIRTAFTIRSK